MPVPELQSILHARSAAALPERRDPKGAPFPTLCIVALSRQVA